MNEQNNVVNTTEQNNAVYVQNNVVNTTTTVEKEGSKFGWGVLGFFVPLAGLILFLVWLKKKTKTAKAAGIGALIGFILSSVFLVIGNMYFIDRLEGTELETEMVLAAAGFGLDPEYIYDLSDIESVNKWNENNEIINNYSLDKLKPWILKYTVNDKTEVEKIINRCTGYLDNDSPYVKCRFYRTKGYKNSKYKEKKANTTEVDLSSYTSNDSKTDDDKTDEKQGECSFKYEKGANKYQYVIDVEKAYKNNKKCEFLTYKLNDDFTVKFKASEYQYTLYVDDKEISHGLLDIKPEIYINGKTLVTSEAETNVGTAIYLVTPKGVIYSFNGETDLIGMDKMSKKSFKVDDNGNLIISGVRHDDRYGEEIAGQYISQPEMCSSSFEDLINKYGVSENYDFKSDYLYKLGENGDYYSMIYSDKKVTQTWHEFYNKICNR